MVATSTERTRGGTTAADTRVHIGLGCADVEQSIRFYRALLNDEPTKVKPDYAKFEPASPPVTLSLIRTDRGAAAVPPSHFGIRVGDGEAIERAGDRLAAVCPSIRREETVECCYAVQDKIWATDPDGNAWEVYRLIDDGGATMAKQPAEYNAESEACCDAACCSG